MATAGLSARNTKTIDKAGVRTPLAKEAGKNWYVRLPDSECTDARDFVKQRKLFWGLLRETWDEVLTGNKPFVEKTVPGQPPRFAKVFELEDKLLSEDLSNEAVRKAAKEAILKVISEYREDA